MHIDAFTAFRKNDEKLFETFGKNFLKFIFQKHFFFLYLLGKKSDFSKTHVKNTILTRNWTFKNNIASFLTSFACEKHRNMTLKTNFSK